MLRGQRILVIEDEALIAYDLGAAIKSADGEVVGIAMDLERAFELAETPNLTAAIIDLRLNGQSSREVAQRLAEREVPFIFYTGHDETPTLRAWPKAPVLLKPATNEEIIRALARVARGGPAARNRKARKAT
jgi:DNA-binding NarL/FixJ family response regulator